MRRGRAARPALLAPVLLAMLVAACGESGKDSDTPAGSPGASAAPDLSRANVVIISLDTLRSDATSMLGGPAGITPALQAFASQCVLFTQARTQAPHTAPSHMTLFTSTYPSVHGVQNVAFDKEKEGPSKAVITPLPKEIPTLAEVLTAAGLRSIGLTDGGNLNPPHGFDRGFEEYTYALAGAESQVNDALPWIEQLTAAGAGRFFLFWHTYQIHAPYVPPAEYIQRWAPADYDGVMKPRIAQLAGKTFKERFGLMKDVFWKDRETFGAPEARYLRGLYDGNVAYTDDQVARLLEAMKQHGVLDSSIVVLLSDHGEEFFEHGHWQHEDVFEECLRVPLMVRLPGAFGAGRRIDTPVGLIDVMPTLIELLGLQPESLTLPGPVRHDGVSFAAALLQAHEPQARPIISELIATHGGNFDRLVAIQYNGMKAIFDEVRGKRLPDGSVQNDRKLFDLAKDPGEQHDLAAGGSERFKFFEDQHLHFLGQMLSEQNALGADAGVELPVPPGMLQQLEELGYVGTSAGGKSSPQPVLIADFSATPMSGPGPLVVAFTDLSQGEVTSRSWTFGDGGTSTAEGPSHTYANAGTFQVMLKVTGPGGSSTKSGSVTVQSPAVGAIKPNAGYFPPAGCAGSVPVAACR